MLDREAEMLYIVFDGEGDDIPLEFSIPSNNTEDTYY